MDTIPQQTMCKSNDKINKQIAVSDEIRNSKPTGKNFMKTDMKMINVPP